MRQYLGFFILIILLFTFCKNNEYFAEFKIDQLSVDGEKSNNSKDTKINCDDITNQSKCDSQKNICKWVQKGDDYKCISICDSDELTKSVSACNKNELCSFDTSNNLCVKKQNQSESQNLNKCILLNSGDIEDSEDRCRLDKDCEFVDNKCDLVVANADASANASANASASANKNKNSESSNNECNLFSSQDDCVRYVNRCEWNPSLIPPSCENKNPYSVQTVFVATGADGYATDPVATDPVATDPATGAGGYAPVPVPVATGADGYATDPVATDPATGAGGYATDPVATDPATGAGGYAHVMNPVATDPVATDPATGGGGYATGAGANGMVDCLNYGTQTICDFAPECKWSDGSPYGCQYS